MAFLFLWLGRLALLTPPAVVDLGSGAWPSEVVWCCAVVKHMAHRLSQADPPHLAFSRCVSAGAKVWKRRCGSVLPRLFRLPSAEVVLLCKVVCILHHRER